VVDPARYGTLPENVRHEVARSIGAVNRALGRLGGTVLALGPGRWGTHMASLGVPVTFSEINHIAALCEVAQMHAALTPDISLGTHFFGELVEMNMLYFALFPERPGNRLDVARLASGDDCLPDLVPDLAPAVRPVLRLLRADRLEPAGLWLVADAPEQRVTVGRHG